MATIKTELDPTIRTAVDDQNKQPNSCLTILFADIVRPDGETGAAGATAGQSTNQLIVSTVQKHNGSVIRTMGGSVMAEFSDPTLAVHAAVELQRQSAASQALTQDNLQGLRIGIYSSKDERAGIEIFGSMVSAAATITKHAVAGQILVSNDAHEVASQEPGTHCQWFRTIKLDSVAENEDLFEVSWHETPVNVPSRYEVLSQVGNGGMGIVHKVRDRETDEIIALKILKPEIAGDPAMQENLRREVCLARKVTHKNICRIHEFNRSNGVAFISMEFVNGESVLSLLQRVGPLPWNEVMPSALQICAGLREAHLQGIVHRDLKPANIMIDSAGGIKVMDFGIARQFQGTGELTGTMVGTPAYMAPEQLELKRVDARTDVYALGLLLYEMVTGVQPFVGETPIAVALKHLRESPRRPREINSAIPAHAEAIILKCMQKDPAKRFQSIDALTMALRREAGRRPAISHWNSFVADFRRAGHDLQRAVQFGVKTTEDFLRRQDWKALKTRSPKQTMAAGAGVLCLLIGVTVFSVSGSRKSRVNGPSPTESSANLTNQNSSSVASATSAQISANPEITSFAVNLGPGSAPQAEKIVSAVSTKSFAPRTPFVPAPEPKAARTKEAVKFQPAKRASASSPTTPQPAVASTLSATPANDDSAAKADDSNVNPPVSAPAAAPTETVMEEKPVDEKTTAAQPALYLEVGSFKDSAWADNAVDKLTELGFRSTSVHKAVLWMQSYQVRVGPYSDQKALEEARKSLASQGYKPHPVK